MGTIIFITISICILLMSLYFKFSLKLSFVLFGLNFLGIVGKFIYHYMSQMNEVASAPHYVYGILYTYQSFLALFICVGVIVMKSYFDNKKNHHYHASMN